MKEEKKNKLPLRLDRIKKQSRVFGGVCLLVALISSIIGLLIPAHYQIILGVFITILIVWGYLFGIKYKSIE
jgi:ABC-type Mn2+/Zn2+ transport system permease subunit